METMTYDELRQLNGGDVACAIASAGLVAAEAGLVLALPTGGWSLVVAGFGAGAALYGFISGCFN
jgi:hypothetical protein